MTELKDEWENKKGGDQMKMMLIILAIVLLLAPIAQADNSARIEELKAQVQKSMQLIQQYQSAIAEQRDIIIAARAVIGELEALDKNIIAEPQAVTE